MITDIINCLYVTVARLNLLWVGGSLFEECVVQAQINVSIPLTAVAVYDADQKLE